MRIALVAIVALAGLVWVGQSPVNAEEQSYQDVFGPLLKRADCDNSCLRKLMDQYIDALAAHNASRLPLAKYARFTENTIEMPVGEGLWGSIDSVLPEKLVIADPTDAQVVYYGAVKERGRVSLLYVRLKARAGAITDIETTVIRQLFGNFGTFSNLQEAPLAAWNEKLPPSERRPRQEMIALVNQYFEGIEQSNGNIVPFDSECERWENNSHASGGSASKSQSSSSGEPATDPGRTAGQVSTRTITKGMTISETFNTHLFSYIVNITDRRFPVVDEERGIVSAIVLFQHPGNVRSVEVPGHGRVELTGVTSALPNTSFVMETFRVRNGKIVGIYAYDNLMPYRQKPGW